MDKRILELAMEALQAQQAEIQLELEALEIMMRGGAISARPASGGTKRVIRTAAQRKAQSEKMKLIWKRRREAADVSKPVRRAARPKTGPQTDAARKAQSDRMKAYWAKRKADEAKRKRKTA